MFSVSRRWWSELPAVAWAPPWRSQPFRVNPGCPRVWCATPALLQRTRPKSPSATGRLLMRRSPRRAACAAQWRAAERSCRTRWGFWWCRGHWAECGAGLVGSRASHVQGSPCNAPGGAESCFLLSEFTHFHGMHLIGCVVSSCLIGRDLGLRSPTGVCGRVCFSCVIPQFSFLGQGSSSKAQNTESDLHDCFCSFFKMARN